MPKGFDHNNITEGEALTPEHFDAVIAKNYKRAKDNEGKPYPRFSLLMPEPSEHTEYEENGPCYSEEEDFETYDR